jgi:TonB family protein
MSEPATETQTDTPADRLVIRIKMVVEEEPAPPPAPAPRLSKGAMVLIVGVVALVLGWFGIGSLRSDPPPPPAAPAKAPIAAAAPVPAPVEPEVQRQPDAPPSAINKVIPDASQSALATIRGTVRVVVRVTLDQHGTVVAATADDPGPSRYFERLSREAAKKWTFTPAKLELQRSLLIRFNFTRYGATALLPEHELGNLSGGR